MISTHDSRVSHDFSPYLAGHLKSFKLFKTQPEKAGVGGLTPSLATMIPKQLNHRSNFSSVRSQSAFLARCIRSSAK
jgi:hypothetical protein